jgi:XTP/dITP diphosphohydrolase
LELIPLDEVAPELEIEEPFDTFEENAEAKARAVVAATGLAAVADDSGLEVDALGGAPGVRSARYAGEAATDRENNRKLLDALSEVPEALRLCRYRCAAVFLGSDGRYVVTEGACEGRVIFEPRGDLGFGYDPLVVPAGESRTMGEIPLEEKLAFSHRGRAFRALRARLIDLGLI